MSSFFFVVFFFFRAEDGIRDLVRSRGLGDVYKRQGLPHESVVEIDILTGGGEVVTATPTNEHADLFFGFPNSYGTLGYSVRLKIELEPVKRFVELRHLRFTDLSSLVLAMSRIVDDRAYDGSGVDYLDGVVFSSTESYLILGRQTDDESIPLSDYTGDDIYYRSIQHEPSATPKPDRLTTLDYVGRWDTDWVWCSPGIGGQGPPMVLEWEATRVAVEIPY